ncbi:hypothetical protein M9458_049786, partial [Cirrhinus mrigala]
MASEARCQLQKQCASFKVPGYLPYSFRRATFPQRHQSAVRDLPPIKTYKVQQSRPYGPPLRLYLRSRHTAAAPDNRPPKDNKLACRQRWLTNLLAHIAKLGFSINQTKCQLMPRQCIQFLGVQFPQYDRFSYKSQGSKDFVHIGQDNQADWS